MKRIGFYPEVKDINDLTADDLQNLYEDGRTMYHLTDIIRKLIESEKYLDQKLANALINSLHDRDGDLTEQLYVRMLHSRVSSKGSSDANNSEEP